MDRIPTPTPLTDKEYDQLQIQHEKERQERLALLDDKVVQAKLYYYRGVRQATTKTQEHLVTDHNHKPLFTADLDLDAYGTAVVVGTDRQRCEDDTFDKITGIYSLNLTDDMLEALGLSCLGLAFIICMTKIITQWI